MAKKSSGKGGTKGAAVAPKGQSSKATAEGLRIIDQAVAKATASETQRTGSKK